VPEPERVFSFCLEEKMSEDYDLPTGDEEPEPEPMGFEALPDPTETSDALT
jgi:hypothetical protein